jgi:hypothetical protein
VYLKPAIVVSYFIVTTVGALETLPFVNLLIFVGDESNGDFAGVGLSIASNRK